MVSDRFVNNMRAELTANGSQSAPIGQSAPAERTYITKHGMIARRCKVSRELVGDLRRDLTVRTDSEPSDQPSPTERAYTTKHGMIAKLRSSLSTVDSEGILGQPAPDGGLGDAEVFG